MSHSVFGMAQIMPINTQTIPTTKTLSPKPLLPLRTTVFRLRLLSVHRRCNGMTLKASSAPADAVGEVTELERCFRTAPPSDSPTSSVPNYGPVMKRKDFGFKQTVTLEKSKSNEKVALKQIFMDDQTSTKSPGLDTGSGGGDIGKIINHGGGDGGDDDGDDDDYFDDFDDGDEGDEGGLFRRRLVLQEGLVSSAQLVRFLAINARPTTPRLISRTLPQGISRAFIGRMIADPGFLYKLLLEQAATIGCSVLWELKNRKKRIKQEWDLGLINVLTVSACNAIVVWSLAPCRSYGSTFRFDLQNTLQKLPNNIFEKSYPMREFDLQKRILSFLYKAAELCMVGSIAGSVQGALSNLCASKKEGRLSVTIPPVSTNALGYGAFLGLYANLRYQLLCGADSAMFNYFDVIGVALFFSTALRLLNVQLGETSRLAWLGVEVDPLVNSDDILKAYNRPSQPADQSSSKWFISKNAIVSGLGLLGIKQGQGDSIPEGGEAPPPKARRKRIVKRKVTTGSS